MKISVVTISYNQAQFLRECIDSVLNQNYQNFEYFVVDPGSTDGSREIIDSYGNQIIKIYDNDNGPADGLNNGFFRATGDIYYFINSDDYVLPNSFSEIVCVFKDTPEVDVVLAGGICVNKLGFTERVFFPSKVSAQSYVNGAVTLFQQGMFFKADLFKKVGGFNIDNRSCWDGELLLNFTLNGAKFLRLMRKVAAFRLYPESITGSKRFSMLLEADQNRMFELVYGPNIKQNKLRRIYYRIMKLFKDPLYLYTRLFGHRI